MTDTTLSPSVQQTIDLWVAKFPEGEQRSALLMALRAVQDEAGWVSDDAIRAVADYLNLPHIWAFEVVSFYAMYHRKPVGKHVIRVCGSIACHLRGGQDILRYLSEKLSIAVGETTDDGAFTLLETECLAACCGAPALVIDDRRYVENLTPEGIDALLESLKSGGEA